LPVLRSVSPTLTGSTSCSCPARAALDFPEWYGQNLDALKDCLTDFSWCEAAGYVLIIARAEILHAEDPVGFQALNEVFAAAIAEWRVQDLPDVGVLRSSC
jgi:hypothetical protein